MYMELNLVFLFEPRAFLVWKNAFEPKSKGSKI